VVADGGFFFNPLLASTVENADRVAPRTPGDIFKGRGPSATPPDYSGDEYESDDTFFPEPEPGRVRIGPDVITPEGIENLRHLAGQIKLDESLSTRRLNKMMDDIAEKQSVSKEVLKDFQAFVRAMRTWHRELHVAYRDSGYADKKVDADLLKVHQFLTQWDGAHERYRIESRTNELTRISEGSPAVNATTAGFYAFAQVSQRDMRETLAHLDGLSSNKSKLLVDGNLTRTLARDEIWQAKMQLLRGAVSEAKAGNPPEIDVQYYELSSHSMLKALVDAARAGCKVRVNMDPGRFQADREGSLYASEVARKMQTAYRLLDAADAGQDVALTLFPVERELGSDNLMHQKLFRVGERVILGGMNANSASGENVDAAVLIEGPAARELVKVFKRDTRLSAAAKLKEIYDPEHAGMVAAGGMHIGPSALMSLLLNAAGPEARGVDGKSLSWTGATLDSLAEQTGTRLDLLVDFDDANGDNVLSGADLDDFMTKGDRPSNTIMLKREGGRLLARQMKEVVERISDDANLNKAFDVELPSNQPRGTDTVGIGDSSTERMALLLHTISTAEKFVYIPSFVMTRVVARAVAARFNELKAQGKELDVRVVLDPGIYPDGGTPNEPGYLALEDAGIPVRWAKLTRTNATHDRKIHAKGVITEKMALMGSTNMSTKGLLNNWELSGIVKFDDTNSDSLAQRDHLIEDFLKTWEHESIRIDTKAVANNRLKEKNVADKAARIEESRRRVVFESLRMLYNYEVESARLVAGVLAENPKWEHEIQAKCAAGMTRGYATLQVLEEKLGVDGLAAKLNETEAGKKLATLQHGDFAAAV